MEPRRWTSWSIKYNQDVINAGVEHGWRKGRSGLIPPWWIRCLAPCGPANPEGRIAPAAEARNHAGHRDCFSVLKVTAGARSGNEENPVRFESGTPASVFTPQAGYSRVKTSSFKPPTHLGSEICIHSRGARELRRKSASGKCGEQDREVTPVRGTNFMERAKTPPAAAHGPAAAARAVLRPRAASESSRGEVVPVKSPFPPENPLKTAESHRNKLEDGSFSAIRSSRIVSESLSGTFLCPRHGRRS